MHLKYLLLRLVRHFMPASSAHFLLRRGWLIRPGMETSEPEKAVQRYLDILNNAGYSITGKRALIFGYGGNFAVGCDLLSRGASQVVLCDKYASPDDNRNRSLVSQYPQYLNLEEEAIVPNPQYITLVHDDIRLPAVQDLCGGVHIVLSTSVYEHLDDVDGITNALAEITQTDGVHLHFIDLRDHYFKYPFEMLRFSERVWKGWLNPTSNLNRFRLPDYQRIFEKYFSRSELIPMERDLAGLKQARASIRPEFRSGDDQIDSVTILKVMATK
jgi:hypothetical protein